MFPDGLNDEDEQPFSKADYEAAKQIAIRNGGTITKDQLVADGIIEQVHNKKPAP